MVAFDPIVQALSRDVSDMIIWPTYAIFFIKYFGIAGGLVCHNRQRRIEANRLLCLAHESPRRACGSASSKLEVDQLSAVINGAP